VKDRLLLAEDEPALARGLIDTFKDEGYDVHHVARGDQVEAALRQVNPDILVLDILLPGRSGLDVLRDLRGAGNRVPTLMLTAKAEVVDRVVGLELGADDYLAKPFAMRELIARVRALLRRAQPAPTPARVPDALSLGGIRFDFQAMTAVGSPSARELTLHDLLVLKVLAARRGEVVPRIDIVEEVCGMQSEATLRKVDNHVVALRRAIGDDPRRPHFIQTVRGEGYRLAPADRS
jgi:DNA-binding response OmpR family regulator